MSDSKYLILSCDGGGIRGVVTTMLLQNLGQQFLNQVDFFAGTSTGSIIALGLASGVSIETLTGIYQNPQACGQIFSGDGCGVDPFKGKRRELEAALTLAARELRFATGQAQESWWDLIFQILDQLPCPDYSNDGRKQLLQANLPDATLGSLSKQALVTTFQLNSKNSIGQLQWSATTLHNLPNLPNSGTSETLLVDAAMCSSSAPLYFPPYQLPSGTLCVDGGVFANNPSTVALTSLIASGLLGSAGLSNVYMLSVGTGSNRSSYPYSPTNVTTDVLSVIPYGILGWLWPKNEDPVPAFPLLQVMFDGSSQVNDFQSGLLLPSGQYSRAQVDLGANHVSLADCSSFQTLVDATNDYIQHSQDWQNVVNWVSNNFPS